METNYPSSGSKGSAGIPGTGTTGGTAGSTGSSASAGSIAGGSASRGSTSAAGGSPGAGSYDDIGSTSSTSQSASQSGKQSGAWSGGTSGSSGGQGMGNLRDELSSLKSDLDDLVSRATQLSDRELSEARDRMMAKFGSMRSAARGMADQARTQLNQGMDVTSDYVRDKPLQSVAIAAGVGLLVGALMRGGRD